ncbi:hypothetical protein L596_006813 [Steinernema carpocapsae]|uniref:Uncharacterized protein n=1 Tax=Steinernema carpocapsae TaxID=34508 RepID=A0A4U5P6V5_STECR|nr:hypothetical protein L596_006813 [Steinernema carpocapsae]
MAEYEDDGNLFEDIIENMLADEAKNEPIDVEPTPSEFHTKPAVPPKTEQSSWNPFASRNEIRLPGSSASTAIGSAISHKVTQRNFRSLSISANRNIRILKDEIVFLKKSLEATGIIKCPSCANTFKAGPKNKFEPKHVRVSKGRLVLELEFSDLQEMEAYQQFNNLAIDTQGVTKNGIETLKSLGSALGNFNGNKDDLHENMAAMPAVTESKPLPERRKRASESEDSKEPKKPRAEPESNSKAERSNANKENGLTRDFRNSSRSKDRPHSSSSRDHRSESSRSHKEPQGSSSRQDINGSFKGAPRDRREERSRDQLRKENQETRVPQKRSHDREFAHERPESSSRCHQQEDSSRDRYDARDSVRQFSRYSRDESRSYRRRADVLQRSLERRQPLKIDQEEGEIVD